ncbi:MAG: hydrogenase iron-sulfur subunit [Thermoplasmata archaeon]
MVNTVVVIGGGIAGIQASLDLAEAGCRVVLVEKEPSIGGKMAALDKNFPTLDCSICIEAPKISEVIQNQNIEVLTLAEVVDVQGEEGNFTVTIEQRARYVTDECTRCDDCVPVCPQVLPNEFDVGVGARKAIYTPFEQAEPGAYVVDIEACLNDPPNYLPCDRCVEACLPRCIDFTMKPVGRHVRRAAAILVATGFDLFDPRHIPEYGYGGHPDILTSLEFERFLNAAGPTAGEVVKPTNGDHPHRLLFVLCVGSRDQRFCHYCSRVCCMYSIKEAVQAKDHGVEDVTVLYMDIRAYGKGFDDFYQRAREEGVRFLRGRPARIEGNGAKVRVRYEDTLAGTVKEEDFDMVVLAPALLPSRGLERLSEVLDVDLDEDGFVKTVESRGGLQRTTREGIYVCGCASGPKDIPDSVAEASGAAARAMAHVEERSWPLPEEVEPIDTSGPAKVGVFICDCGSNIAGTVEVPDVVDHASGLDGVAHSEELMFACSAKTQGYISDIIREKRLTRAVVAACSPKTHGPTFQRVCTRAGLNPYLLEMANIRNQDSWVHKHDREAATEKAKDLVKMAVEKAKRLQPLTKVTQKVVQKALVVGGGVAGMSAAAALARQGFETHLVERELHLGGLVRRLSHLSGVNVSAKSLLKEKEEELARARARIHLGTDVQMVSGYVGNFHVTLSNGERLDVGAILMATGSRPHVPNALGYGQDPRVITNLQLEGMMPEVGAERVTFLGCVGSRQGTRGCSRYCCQSMIQQALQLRKMGKRVRIVTKDIRTYGRHAEELYEEACRRGVQFFRISEESPSEELVEWEAGRLILHDQLSGERVAIPTDLLVLAVGLEALEKGAVEEQLKLAVGEDGFLLESHPKLGPVEAAVQGVYLAGACQGPKDVGEAISQGLGAAAKASVLLSRDEVEQEPLTAIVDSEICTGCTLCAKVCPYSAIIAEVKKPAIVIEAACTGCGTCAAACPVDAITMPGFTDEQIIAQIDAAVEEDPEEKVVVFACNWCSYAGADQAGIAKFQYPPSSRIIRTMCSGRVSEKFVLRAFERGAGAVLISGCHPGDCHYLTANYETAKRVPRWRKKLEARGYDPKRLELAWFTAAEGKLFASKMKEMHEFIAELKAVGPRSAGEATEGGI